MAYKNTEINVEKYNSQHTEQLSQVYKGFSTVDVANYGGKLYDFDLIKQDILNHFNTRKGERLMNPTFGTIIWDMIFEPLTEVSQQLIIKDVENIINHDPRVIADQVVVTSYESGIQIECRLTYLPYNIQESLTFRFDEANGLIN